MPEKAILFVESPNDQHVFYALLQRFAVPEVCKVEPKGGVSNVLKTLRVQLKIQDEEAQFERIGVVVDADADLQQRWNELRNILVDAGYQNVPERPEPIGTIIRQEGSPTVGVWIMPNNTVPGELEDFISFLVPSDDVLWQHTIKVVEELPERRFAEADQQKSHVHTWLVWQKDPGTPMGWAITKKYLNTNVEEVQRLMDWFQALFVV